MSYKPMIGDTVVVKDTTNGNIHEGFVWVKSNGEVWSITSYGRILNYPIENNAANHEILLKVSDKMERLGFKEPYVIKFNQDGHESKLVGTCKMLLTEIILLI